MARIPTQTLDGVPPASRALLESIAHASPTGHPLNFQAQMGHSTAVLASYVGLRRAGDEYGTLDPKVRAAVMLTAAEALGNDYAEAVASMLARRSGWSEPQVAALATGAETSDFQLDSLLSVVRQAAAEGGRVTDRTWQSALEAGWSGEQLTEAFAPLGVIAYTTWFMNYAQSERDMPTAPNSAGP